jgi:hypothetical protein
LGFGWRAFIPPRARAVANKRVKEARPMPRRRLKRLKNDGEGEESDCMDVDERGVWGEIEPATMPADRISSIRKPV